MGLNEYRRSNPMFKSPNKEDQVSLASTANEYIFDTSKLSFINVTPDVFKQEPFSRLIIRLTATDETTFHKAGLNTQLDPDQAQQTWSICSVYV